MVCLSRPYPFKFFKGCLPQNLLSPLLNTLSHIFLFYVEYFSPNSLGTGDQRKWNDNSLSLFSRIFISHEQIIFTIQNRKRWLLILTLDKSLDHFEHSHFTLGNALLD